MTKIWDGPTPCDVEYQAEQDDDSGSATRILFLRAKIEGYRAAMNSLEVRALHNWCRHCGGCLAVIAYEAYEAGLKGEA